MRTKDGRVFKSKLGKRKAEQTNNKHVSTAHTPQKVGKQASEMDRLCAENTEEIRDLFQKKLKRRQSWDPIKDGE